MLRPRPELSWTCGLCKRPFTPPPSFFHHLLPALSPLPFPHSLLTSPLLLLFCFWLCIPSLPQVLGKAAVGLALWALWNPSTGPEPSRKGISGTEADQHQGRTTLEKHLQHQCHPPAGHQHLSLGLFCMTPQTQLQPKPAKHSVSPVGCRDRLSSYPALNWRLWRLSMAEIHGALI